MSNGQEDVSSQPLVIIRRRRTTDEPHHGGVWKIAYADFMTAMMAFFLVMWLINAAD
jgi:chemotaxis protein MotB